MDADSPRASARPCVGVARCVLGPLDNNVYVIEVGACQVLVVDPTCDADAILEAVGGRTVAAIALTHHHADHMGAAAELRRRTGAPVIASAVEAPLVENPKKVGTSPLPLPEACEVDARVEDGQTVTIGEIAWRVLLTPGHSQGSMCLLAKPQGDAAGESDPVLVSGDTLFAGAVGRTDFEGGSMADMVASLRTLAELPDETIVLPGHGSATTIAAERARVFARYLR